MAQLIKCFDVPSMGCGPAEVHDLGDLFKGHLAPQVQDNDLTMFIAQLLEGMADLLGFESFDGIGRDKPTALLRGLLVRRCCRSPDRCHCSN